MGEGTRASRPLDHLTCLSANRKTIEIAARHRLEPYRQGQLDGLCALYASINALRLALAEHTRLTERRCKDLFAEGVNFLHRKDGLHTATTKGMGTKRRLALVRHLAKHVSTMTSCLVVVEQPDHSSWSTIHDAFEWIDESLSVGKPVLIALLGALDHYTVIAGSTAATLRLVDSTGILFIRKPSCGHRTAFHQIPFNGLLRIAIERPG